MALTPWYKVVSPRPDLREGRPLDASEFAVHLDKVREGNAPAVYQEPVQFFRRTFMTNNLIQLSSEVLRRLSGEKTETSAVFNLSTQFGGGKTHALTLLYHLVSNGDKSHVWPGVSTILDKVGLKKIPKGIVAVFVGERFDPIDGRGGADGTPKRKTPWAEIAYQIGGEAALKIVAEHEEKGVAPAGEVIQQILPKDKPCLILMDEVMSYVSRVRKLGMSSQFYNFLQSLSEEARSRNNVALIVSIPKSDLEMSSEDESDFQRLKKLLDRVGKAVLVSSEDETAEIIRRRLFEWDDNAIGANGKVLLSKDAIKTCKEYAEWVKMHKTQLPTWFDIDHAEERFKATYPFHPMLISVFERKWQALPRFQRTRGILRLLALWISKAYKEGYKEVQNEPLIASGSAPFDDTTFRTAMFEQLGEARLEVAVNADISDFATRLDAEGHDEFKKNKLHKKAASAIFFESNGGQLEHWAEVPEILFAVATPEIDIENIRTAIDTLASCCYYISSSNNRYKFSMSPNLNKLLADRKASIMEQNIEEQWKIEIEEAFKKSEGIDVIFFPQKSIDIPDRPVITFVVLSLELSMQNEKETKQFIEKMTREYGTSSRVFKSSLIWCVPSNSDSIRGETRKVLAWEDLAKSERELNLDESQKKQLGDNLKRAQRDLRESIWQTYKVIALLDKENKIKYVDLGLSHSSSADSIVDLIKNRLIQDAEVTKSVSPNFIKRFWPGHIEWSTKAVRDAFFSSPQFPKLLNQDAVRDAIIKGASQGIFAYVGKPRAGKYEPFYFQQSIAPTEVELSEEMYIIPADKAKEYLAKTKLPTDSTTQPPKEQPKQPPTIAGPLFGSQGKKKLKWQGNIPWQKWSQFYSKFMAGFVSGNELDIKVEVNIENISEGLSEQKINEAQSALRDLGINGDLEVE